MSRFMSIDERAFELAKKLVNGDTAEATVLIRRAMRKLVIESQHRVCFDIGRCNDSHCPVRRMKREQSEQEGRTE